MLALALLSSAAVQLTPIPLEGPAEVPYGVAAFEHAGDAVVLHRGTVTRHDRASGALLDRFNSPDISDGEPHISRDRAAAYQVNGPFAFGVNLQPFTALPPLLLSGVSPTRVISDLGADRAILMHRRASDGLESAAVFEISTGALLRSIEITDGQINDPADNAALAADGRTLVYVDRSTTPSDTLKAFDIETGSEVARVVLPGLVGPYPPTSRRGRDLIANAASDEIVVRTYDESANELRFSRFAIPTLTSLGTVVQTGSDGMLFWTVDADARVVFGTDNGQFVRLDLLTGASSSVPAFDDLTRTPVPATQGVLMVHEDSLQTPVLDINTGAIAGTLEGPYRRPTYRTAMPAPPVSEFVIQHRLTDARFSVTRTGGTQPERLGDFHDGLPTDADPPFHLAFAPSLDRLAVAAEYPSNLRVVSGTDEVGLVVVGKAPIDVQIAEGRWAAVLCRDDMRVDLVDMTNVTLTSSFALAETPIEMDVVGDEVWVRTQGTTSELVGVRIVAGALLPIGSTALAGIRVPRQEGLPAPDTVVIDPVRRIAYAASAPTGIVERIDLASATVTEQIDLQQSDARPHLLINESGTSVIASLLFGSEARLAHLGNPYQDLVPEWTATFSSSASPSLAQGSGTFFSDQSFVMETGRRSRIRAVDGVVLGPADPLPENTLAPQRYGNFVIDDAGNFDRVDGQVFVPVRNASTLFRGTSAIMDAPSGRAWFGQSYSSMGIESGLALYNAVDQETENVCVDAEPNSTGQPSNLIPSGLPYLGHTLTLTADGLAPGTMVGYLLVGSARMPAITPPGSVGRLCLSGSIGRYVNQVQAAGPAGTMDFAVDGANLPLSGGTGSAGVGETWFFQLWYRDSVGGMATSNFGQTLSVRFF